MKAPSKSLFLVLVVVSMALVVDHRLFAAAAPPAPNWISARNVAPGAPAYFRHEAEVTQPVTSARLVAAASEAGFDLYLNGKLVTEYDAYDPLLKLDLTREFTRRKHVIAVRCRPASSNAMFFIRMHLKFADGTQQFLVTDKSWQCSANLAEGWMDSTFQAEGWNGSVAQAAVDQRLLISDERRIDLAASDNYEQWRQASGAHAGADPGDVLNRSRLSDRAGSFRGGRRGLVDQSGLRSARPRHRFAGAAGVAPHDACQPRRLGAESRADRSRAERSARYGFPRERPVRQRQQFQGNVPLARRFERRARPTGVIVCHRRERRSWAERPGGRSGPASLFHPRRFRSSPQKRQRLHARRS